MKFKGKPIENSLKLPPCQFSDVYSDKKGGKRRTMNKKRRTMNKKRRTMNKKRRTMNKKRRTMNKKRRQKMSNRTRKGGSGKKLTWMGDNQDHFFSNTVPHLSIPFNKKTSTNNVSADNILSILEEGKGSILTPKVVSGILKGKKN